MRIVLAQPPLRDFYFTPHRASALGLAALEVHLRALGAETVFFNFPVWGEASFGGKDAGCGPADVPLPKGLSHVKPFLVSGEKGPLSFFSRYRRFGPSFEFCAQEIVNRRPRALLISSFAFAYADDALCLAEAVKKLALEIFICIGGAGVSAWPEYYLRGSAVDAAVSGEGEPVVAPLLAALARRDGDYSGVPNLVWKNAEGMHDGAGTAKTRDSDLEFGYSISGGRHGSKVLTTSLARGCPKACKFCSIHLSHGNGFRRLPLEKLNNGLLGFTGVIDTIIFEDDNLLCDWDYASRVLDLFVRRFPGVKILAENGLDYTFLTPERMLKLARFGFTQFNISLGTLDAANMAKERRGGSLSLYEALAEEAEYLKIPVITYFIAGLAGDNRDSLCWALNYLSSKNTKLGISMFYAVPGLDGVAASCVRGEVEAKGSHICAGSSAFPWNKSLSVSELVTAFRLARFVNAIKAAKEGLITDEKERQLLKLVLTEKKLYTLVKRKKETVCTPVECTDAAMERAFFSAIKGIL